ncbi:hypothetical protein [Tunicatimonas pelagia]|uniref:hypothetical protein n=1 Tax=Tunicatimonas pelagia TaxID=931531 RepID=UPI002666BC36|nr:hypothetical protein [Tunicatimonas pelagia]WKN40710.1 hypothetical protein P0M28_16855 [Tunicatimonas pelagia]
MAKDNQTESEELIEVFKKLEPRLNKVYVGATLKNAIVMQNNRYIRLLYQDFSAYQLPVEFLIRDNFHEVIWRRMKGEKSIVHHHWLQFDNNYSLKPLAKVFLGLFIFRMLGGTIVWTLHNKLPHDNPYPQTNTRVRKWFAKISTHLHVHCTQAREEMSQFLKVSQNKFFVVKHPNYPVTTQSQEESWTKIRQRYADHFDNEVWHQPGTTYLMFGQIKPYKGIAEVVDLFLAHSESNKRLLVVGRIKDEAYVDKVRDKVSDAANVILIPQFIADEDTPLFYGISEYVIFNYTSILTSGGAIEALNYRKKIIAPRKGCLTDLVGENIIHFDTLSELKNILFS